MPRSLHAVFQPKSVAVVGASRRAQSVGGAIVSNLLAGGFEGPVYPVNAHARFVQSVAAFPSLSALPETPDLVVVAVPAAGVLAVVREAAALKVPAALIVSSGFGETGPEGRELEQQLRRLARDAKMRIVGPNCLGVLNPAAEVRLNATFGTAFPPSGNLAFASQSGAIGLAALERAAALGVGFSGFVSLGNKADVSGNDVLEYFEADPKTRAVLLYLESFGNPARFREIATRVGRHKPIVLVKSGRSAAGARAAGSHTGAMAGTDDVITALCEQAGVIRAESLEGLFEAAMLLADAPLPAGRRVAIVTNAGGPGILAADALDANGMFCPPLGAQTQAVLRAHLPAAASVTNPVDTLADVDAATYGRALRLALADPQIQSVIAIYVPPVMGDAIAIASEIAAASLETRKTIAVCMLGSSALEEASTVLRGAHLACFPFPEAPARALGMAVRYAEWKESPHPAPEAPAAPPNAAVEVLTRARRRLGRSGGWLSAFESADFARAWGLPMVQEVRTDPNLDAVELAVKSLGLPVVLKAEIAGVVHKSEAHAVEVGLDDLDKVRGAVRRLARLEPVAFVVQRHVAHGEEWIVGAVRDPHFGPLVTVGAGGTRTELIHDVHHRLAPLSERDLDALIEQPRIGRTLRRWRGGEPGDAEALKEFIRVLARAAVAHPGLGELECNPVRVLLPGEGVVGLDMRLHLLPEHG